MLTEYLQSTSGHATPGKGLRVGWLAATLLVVGVIVGSVGPAAADDPDDYCCIFIDRLQSTCCCNPMYGNCDEEPPTQWRDCVHKDYYGQCYLDSYTCSCI